MDPNRVADEVYDLAKRLVSLDPIEFDSVVNQYFESHVTSNFRSVELRGASRLKKFLKLQAALAFESHLAGKPHYHSHNQVIHLAVQRIFYPPSVPASLPLAANINGFLKQQHLKFTWDTQLHLNAGQEEAGGETRLYVTKVGPTRRRGTTSIEDILPWFILTPIVSIIALVLANVVDFFSRHSLYEEGPIAVFFAAVAESWASLTGGPADKKNYPQSLKQAEGISHRVGDTLAGLFGNAQKKTRAVGNNAQAQATKKGHSIVDSGLGLVGASIGLSQQAIGYVFHTAGAIEQQGLHTASDIANGVIHSATGLEQQLEKAAKDRGIPVDDYKKLAEKNVRDVLEWFGVAKQQVKEKASDEGKKLGYNPLDLGDSVPPLEHNLSGDNGIFQPTIDSSLSAEVLPIQQTIYESEVTRIQPVTLDPKAPGAPSYADIAHEHVE